MTEILLIPNLELTFITSLSDYRDFNAMQLLVEIAIGNRKGLEDV